MKTLIVYDSLYGNTAAITREIAAGLDQTLGPDIGLNWLQVGQAEPAQLQAANLLILGSPTQRFKPTLAMQHLLRRIPAQGLAGVRAAAFDTRLTDTGVRPAPLRWLVKIGGYAADVLADQLIALGAELILPPEGFWVSDSEGPLQPDELERARAWGVKLSCQCAEARPRSLV